MQVEFLNLMQLLTALLLLYYCFTPALLTYIQVEVLNSMQLLTALLLLYYCFTPALLTYIQVEVLNSMQLLTAKQCVLLVNLSSGTHFTCFTSTNAQLLTRKNRVSLAHASSFFFPFFPPEDCIRKKNKWLPKIKEWVDAHAPSDVVVPIRCPYFF
jgi:hypothetical protein